MKMISMLPLEFIIEILYNFIMMDRRATKRDNYGAGKNASPYETHTYWLEVCKQE